MVTLVVFLFFFSLSLTDMAWPLHFFYRTLFLLLGSELHLGQNSRLHGSFSISQNLSAQYTYRP